MNKISLNSKVSLLEIIFSVIIFAAAGIIMLNCFGIARFTQIRANDKAAAGAIIQSDIEIIKSLKNPTEMHEFLDDSYDDKSSDNPITYTKYFDEKWVQGRGKHYTVTISVEEENINSGVLVSISISAKKTKPYPFIKKGGQDVYLVESKKFFPLTGGAYE
jgi:type II secretory pathway pseudopilin PulG